MKPATIRVGTSATYTSKNNKEQTERSCGDVEDKDASLAILQKHALGLDVDVEVRNHDQRDHDQSRNQNTRDHRRKVMQHFLQSEKVPRRLGGVGRVRGIGNALKRRVEQKSHAHQRDRQHLNGDDGAEENLRIGLNLIFVRRP